MSKFIVAGFILLAVCLPVSVNAYGKTTIDPNITELKTFETIPNEGDVAQKITYEAKRKTVLSILTDLGKMTDVTLKAGYNNEDWQVRDRRMNIFVKDIPLANLMNSIARVMKFKWSKSKTNAIVSYRLIADKKALLDAQRQRQTKMEQVRQRCIQGRQRLLSGIEAADKMSKDELEELKIQSPYTYMMANSWQKCLPQMFTETPSAKEAWLRGDRSNLNINSMSPDVLQALSSAFGFVSDTVSHGSIAITGIDDIKDTNLAAGVALVYVGSESGALFKSSLLSDPESESAKIGARFYNSGPHNDSEYDQYRKELSIVRESEMIDMGEPLTKHPEAPALSAKVKMKVEGDRFADILAALAESSGFAIVSDSFDPRLWNLNFSSPETEIRGVLDKLEHDCRFNWEMHDSTLELHSRDWFRKRDTLIPEARLETWRKAFKEHGTLNINELAQIATLTPDQIRVNVSDDDVLENAGLNGIISDNRDLLSLYCGLTTQQQALVFTEQGLDQKQGLNLDSIISYNNGSIMDLGLEARHQALRAASNEEVKLVGAREKHGKQTKYSFSIVTPSGEVVGKPWNFETPLYSPPKEAVKVK